MRLRELHSWDLTPAEAIALQAKLAPQVIAAGDPGDVRYVAAADAAFVRGTAHPEPRRSGAESRVEGARAAVVLLSYPNLDLVEQHVVEAPVTFPYVPGLLSFRETPVLARAFARLEHEPDLLLVDGHGVAHPRRFGIACHLGLLAGRPTIGVANGRLCGEPVLPGPQAGSSAELIDRGEVIGLVLQTRQAVAPLYVSVGHRIGLREASQWTLRLCRGYRLPEPIRLADRLSKGHSLKADS